MSQFRLDYSKAQAMQISNDAFFFIAEEEEPLDEENLEEAKEVLSMFPNGFYIEENWKPVENSDLIEVTFIPYVEDKNDYDEYLDLTNYKQLQIKWLDKSCIKLWQYEIKTGVREFCGEFKVHTNKYGHKYFHTGKNQNAEFIPGEMSLYFLKHFSKRN